MLGRRHPSIRRLRRLRSDRSLRDSESVFLAEGIHLVAEAVDHGAEIECVIHSSLLPQRPGGAELLDHLLGSSIPVEETRAEVLDSIQDARSPQPVVAVVRRREISLASVLDAREAAPLVVVTVGLQDPGNLGSILRSADAAGATCLAATGEHVDPYHPRAVRATAGSIYRLPVCSGPGPEELLSLLSGRGIARVGAEAGGSTEYHRFDWTGPLALFLGREGSGLPEPVRASLTDRVSIPMRPGVESLSVGAAAAVLLFEAARRRAAR